MPYWNLKLTLFRSSGHSSEDAVNSFDCGQDEPDQIQEPVISYAIRGKATLMSAWEDPHYFTGAFPTLFPYGIGGHIDKRKVLVGLEAYVQWALNHHSIRFARHRSFLYLMYEVIRLRMASLGHRLLVKRRDWLEFHYGRYRIVDRRSATRGCWRHVKESGHSQHGYH
jgi:hypothetical protein